ncbi:MAG TPA: hypothetical protein VIW80_03155 [Pyrinomonadaceae bacterium]
MKDEGGNGERNAVTGLLAFPSAFIVAVFILYNMWYKPFKLYHHLWEIILKSNGSNQEIQQAKRGRCEQWPETHVTSGSSQSHQ